MSRLQKCSFYFLIAFMLIVILSVSGCSKPPEAIEKEPAVIPVVIDNSFSETVMSENDQPEKKQILIEYAMQFPEIENTEDHQGLLLINEYFLKLYRDVMEYGYQQAYTFALNDFEDRLEMDQEFFIPHGYGISYEVPYNKNGLLSVIIYEYTYTGGAHPSMFRTAVTFDTRTGQQVTLADLLTLPDQEATEYVLSEIDGQIKAQIDSEEFFYFDGYQTSLRESFNGNDFYIEEDSLVLYYQQYAIAPYAAGFPEFRIPSDQVPLLIP